MEFTLWFRFRPTWPTFTVFNFVWRYTGFKFELFSLYREASYGISLVTIRRYKPPYADSKMWHIQLLGSKIWRINK